MRVKLCTGEEGLDDNILASTCTAAKLSPGMEDVVARMKDLATNRGDAKRRSKRDRSSLKSTFRDLCSTLEVGSNPRPKLWLQEHDVRPCNAQEHLKQSITQRHDGMMSFSCGQRACQRLLVCYDRARTPASRLLQEGCAAETKVKLRAGDTLVINTVAGNVQLNYVRRFLNEGFQTHLQNNELLHQASC